MSERETMTLAEIVAQLHDLLCDLQHPAQKVMEHIDNASEARRAEKALKRAAHQAEDLFESVVSAACAAGDLLTELKEVNP